MTDTTTTTTTTDSTANLTPADAAAKLAALTEDKSFGERLFRGDVATRREFDSLSTLAATAGGRLDAVLSGAEPPMVEMTDEDHPMRSRDLATVVGWLREDGVSDATIRQIAEGQPVSAKEHRIAETALSRCMGDKDWTKRLMSGGANELRDHRLLLAIVGSPIKE